MEVVDIEAIANFLETALTIAVRVEPVTATALETLFAPNVTEVVAEIAMVFRNALVADTAVVDTLEAATALMVFLDEVTVPDEATATAFPADFRVPTTDAQESVTT